MVGHWFHAAADFATTWLPLAFFVVIALTAWLLWRTAGMMPRIKPANMVHGAKSQTSWADVAGVEEVRGELMEVVEFMRDPKRFERLGAKVPKGILLYGPPGTGKTLLAKAVAHESGANFYSASASSFVEMFAGLGAARIRKLFNEARKNAPAIVFIDELDAVGAQRSGHGFNREQDQTLNQLLVELDGFENARQVVVMGASNRIQDLDPALLRPGRFDRQMLVPPPGPRRPGGHPPRPHARQAAQPRRRRSGNGRAPDVRAHRCRAREHLQRGGDQGRPPQRIRDHAVGLRLGPRAGGRRPAAAQDADREGAAHPRLPRGRPRSHGAT